MLKTLKILTFMLVMLIASFLFTPVKALELVNEPNDIEFYTGQSGDENFTFGQSFVAPFTGYLDLAQIGYTGNSFAYAYAYLEVIEQYHNNDGLHGTNMPGINNWAPASPRLIQSVFNFDTRYAYVQKGHTYVIRINPGLRFYSGGWKVTNLTGSTFDSYSDGQFGHVISSAGNEFDHIDVSTTLKDLNFELRYASTTEGIDFLNHKSVLNDFKSWGVQFGATVNGTNLVAGDTNIVVSWAGTASDGVTAISGLDSYPITNSNTLHDIFAYYDGTIFIAKQTNFPSSTHIFAKAAIVNHNGATLEESPIWEFTTNNAQQSDYTAWDLQYGVASSTAPFDSCTSASSAFDRITCSLYDFLLRPSEQSLANFSELGDKVEKKPPFAYISIYASALNGFSSSTSVTSSIDDVTLVSYLSTIQNISFFSTLYDIMTWLIWLLFGFYIYHRFRHFSLHG